MDPLETEMQLVRDLMDRITAAQLPHPAAFAVLFTLLEVAALQHACCAASVRRSCQDLIDKLPDGPATTVH